MTSQEENNIAQELATAGDNIGMHCHTSKTNTSSEMAASYELHSGNESSDVSIL